MDELGREILRIAFPAALALAADPIASLIDTAFIGRIGMMVMSMLFHMKSRQVVIVICWTANELYSMS